MPKFRDWFPPPPPHGPHHHSDPPQHGHHPHRPHAAGYATFFGEHELQLMDRLLEDEELSAAAARMLQQSPPEISLTAALVLRCWANVIHRIESLAQQADGIDEDQR